MKYYATGALGAQWIAVAALIADRPGETATVFIRPDQPGVTLDLEKWSAIGQRGTKIGAGTSGTDGEVNLDRHWRNVRTHSLHDPARWKYVHLGNHTLHGTRPPRLGLVL